MSASLSPTFLDDLAQVYATLRPEALSAAFLTDLEQVHVTLPFVSDADLRSLANYFQKWRHVTQEFVRTHLATLEDDDPLLCPISLFRTMEYGRLETAHTRTLAWLLHPEGEHGFENALLAALLRRLPGYDCSREIRVERVESEFPIDASGAKGRLDVLAKGNWEGMEGNGWILVIEAKVDAGERNDQVQKYENWLGSHAADRKVFRVFLTPDGRAPESGAEEWELLSYLELVQVFRSVYNRLRDKKGFHFLKSYLAGVLQDVCNFPRNMGVDAADPYAVASYINTLPHAHSEGASHDAAR